MSIFAFFRKIIKLGLGLLFAASILLNIGLVTSQAVADTVGGLYEAVTGWQSAQAKQKAQYEKLKADANKVRKSVKKRSARIITSNVGSFAIDRIPIIGFTAGTGLTVIEIHQGCKMLEDISALDDYFEDQPPTEEDAIEVCGLKVKDILAKIRNKDDAAEQEQEIPDDIQEKPIGEVEELDG